MGSSPTRGTVKRKRVRPVEVLLFFDLCKCCDGTPVGSPTRGTESKKEGEQASVNLFAKMIERLLFSIAGHCNGTYEESPTSLLIPR